MSGPPYPHPNPAPGSNAIGEFVIGVSPIGTISAFDVWSTILSQYANSPTLSSLCSNMAQYLDQTTNFDDFFDFIWNVDTAVGRGLDIWGRIVGVQRVLHVPTGTRYFGFEEAGGLTVDPFNQSPFYSGATLTDNFYLSDDAFRILIFAKALANISDGSIKAINQLLINLFPNRGNAYVIDNLDMTMTYRFSFHLTPVEAAIMEQTGVLPTPTGVLANVEQDD
jgi:hypothetical protein